MTTDLPAGTAHTPAPASRRPDWRGILLESVGVLALFAAGGALAGWIWEKWATVPQGVAFDGEWRLGYRIEGDFFVGDNDWFERAFGVIGTYVVLGVVSGLVIGVVVSLVCRRSELATLAAVAVGSVLAAFVCYRVGLALGAPDPASVARGAADGTIIPADLAIEQRGPFVVWPLGSLIGLTMVYLLTSGVSAGVAETRRVDLGKAPGSDVPVPPTRQP